MPTPEDIAEQRFVIALRGYDRQQVTEYLAEVGEHVATLERRIAELSDELATARAGSETGQAPDGADPSRPFAALGEETQRVLEAAQEAATAISRKAQQDADRQLQAARQSAAKLIAEGERRRDDIEAEIARLQGHRTELAGQLAGLDRTLQGLLSELEPEEAPTVRQALTEAAAAVSSADGQPQPEPQPEPEPQPQPEPAAEPAPPAGEEGTAVDPPAAEAEDAQEDAPSPVTLRANALEPLHPKMVRRLKRGLSDLQNLVLDRLRRASGRPEAETLAPEEQEVAVLAELGQSFLDDAYKAGVDAAAFLAGRSLDAPARTRALDGEFAADAADRLRQTLSASLRIGLSNDEPVPVLYDRVGTVFSELKSTAADELCATHLIRAYEYGLLDAWAAGGVQARTWVLGRELRCPEGRCRHNDETGVVDMAKAFPSGHDVPPLHVGCTCTTIPVLEP